MESVRVHHFRSAAIGKQKELFQEVLLDRRGNYYPLRFSMREKCLERSIGRLLPP